jgi:hypothetical protein
MQNTTRFSQNETEMGHRTGKYFFSQLDLEYDPTLLVCFEGLLETDHPYNFAAPQCAKEMLTANGAEQKVTAILTKLVNPLRMAFSSNDPKIFQEALEIGSLV